MEAIFAGSSWPDPFSGLGRWKVSHLVRWCPRVSREGSAWWKRVEMDGALPRDDGSNDRKACGRLGRVMEPSRVSGEMSCGECTGPHTLEAGRETGSYRA